MAVEKGFFKEEGLEPELVRCQWATYKDALQTSGMPSKTHGFFYVDIRAGTGLVADLSGTHLPAEVTRNLKPLRSAVEYAVSRQHQLSVRFFLRIK